MARAEDHGLPAAITASVAHGQPHDGVDWMRFTRAGNATGAVDGLPRYAPRSADQGRAGNTDRRE